MTAPRPVILSDLDDTLFDHRWATRTALDAVRRETPAFECWSADELNTRHGEVLELLHHQVLAGRLSVETARFERFRRLLEAARDGSPSERAASVARQYRLAYEGAWRPVPGAVDLLQRLRAAGAAIAIVTNNIVREQRQKLSACGMATYVDALVTSEEVGMTKPSPAIFHVALDRVGGSPDSAVMLGDAWTTDIDGARAAGIRAVWFNRTGDPTPDPSVDVLRSLEPVDQALRVILRR